MTLEYDDMVRSLTHAYLDKVLGDDQQARAMVREMAQEFGFGAEAGDQVVDHYLVRPLKEWHSQGSAA